jgi:N-acetylneuraminate synthase
MKSPNAATPLPRFRIREKWVGRHDPCFVIAEAGSNHNGELALARRLVEAAADAGADAVKFQTFEAKRLYPRSAGKSDYLGVETSIYDIIEAMEMPSEWLGELQALAHERGLAFISSPFHEEAVELLDPFVDAFKIASYEMTHAPLLRAVARKRKPIIMSTGASTLDEVRVAVDLLRSEGVEALVVLQCTASYPAPLASVQAGALVELRDELGVLSGLSDHSESPTIAPAVAAALGAAVVEKHYTLSKTMDGPDHAFAIEPDGLAALVRAVRAAEQARGDGHKRVHGVEDELRSFARRSLFTTSAVAKGDAFSRENVDVLRQGKLGQGLEPAALPAVLSGTAAVDVPADTPLTAEHVILPSGITLDGGTTEAQPGTLRLRPAEERDLGLVWTWVNDPATRAAALASSDAIPYAAHTGWFRGSLASEDRHLWIAELDGEPVGLYRLDVGPQRPEEAEVSVQIGPRSRGLGLGQRVLRAGAEVAQNAGYRRLTARIRPENAASVRAFEAVGFVKVDGNVDDPARVQHYGLALG